MTTKPDDIPQWAWEEAEGVEIDLINTRTSEEGIGTIARAIIKAKNDAYEESCAEVRKLRLQTVLDGGMVENPYIDAYKAAQAIRNLKHETEV
jgi:hypothetical protein